MRRDISAEKEIEGVGYEYADLREVQERYAPERMAEGWNTMPDGEEVFYISTPSRGCGRRRRSSTIQRATRW